jgi:flagellar basal body-associated protein FliL
MGALGKGKILITFILLILILFFGSGIVLYKTDVIKLPEVPMEKKGGHVNYSKNVNVSIMTNLSTTRLMKIDLAIPCRSEEQHIEVSNNVKAIKTDFLLKFNQKKMEEWLQNRDFDAIKAEFRDIVNDHLAQPVETIYFESLIGY